MGMRNGGRIEEKGRDKEGAEMGACCCFGSEEETKSRWFDDLASPNESMIPWDMGYRNS